MLSFDFLGGKTPQQSVRRCHLGIGVIAAYMCEACANVLVRLGKIVKGWRLAMLEGRERATVCVALVKGETQIAVDDETDIYFNHAPAKRTTTAIDQLITESVQSTLREGSDVQRLLSKRTQLHFNPRSRRKATTSEADEANSAYVSIHTLPQKATRDSAFWRVITNFNHAHAPAKGDNNSSHSCRLN